MGITIIEQQTMHAIQAMSQSLSRIANCLEAAETRARAKEESYLEGPCSFADCPEPVIVMLNNEKFCQKHLDEGFARMRPAMESVRRAFADIEAQQNSDALYDAALASTDYVLGEGAYEEMHKNNPDPGVHRAVERSRARKEST
jgi:hypothetical protein